MTLSPSGKRDFDVVLILSGGNALGAFEAGVYEALHGHGLFPDWIIGASIGAINGALIAGSPVDQRIAALHAFWRPDSHGSEEQSAWIPPPIEDMRRTAAVNRTLLSGRPGIFGPLLSSLMPWSACQTSLFETDQLAATLERMVDFDLLNEGACRFTATAVDLATGDDVVFDSTSERIQAQHVRASAALPVTFPPVEVDGRWLVDGGLSANLPLDPFFAAPPPRPVLCIAVDLLPLSQPLPRTIGEAASRMQDLIFAAQSRRTIARWQAIYASRTEVSIALVRLAYAGQESEVAGKAMDFSGLTVRQRWSSGHLAASGVLARIESGALPIGAPGLNIFN